MYVGASAYADDTTLLALTPELCAQIKSCRFVKSRS